MRMLPCLIVALGAIGAVGTTALTARAQQEAMRHRLAETTAPRTDHRSGPLDARSEATTEAPTETKTETKSETKTASKSAPGKPSPMKVVLVRSNAQGCEPNCAEWIAAQGQIDETTPEQFRRAFAQFGARKLPILIDSIGGEVDASLAIGRLIRAKGLDVVVTKTSIEPCTADAAVCLSLKTRGIETGRPEARLSKCASACAFVLAGGVRRYVGGWTLVGLHEIKAISTLRLVRQHYRLEQRNSSSAQSTPQKRIIKEELIKVETREGPAEERTYAKVGRYFADMGIAPEIMPIMRAAPNSTIHWLKVTELKSTGLATDFINGEQYLADPPAAAVAPSAKPPLVTSTAPVMQPVSRTTVSSGRLPAPKPAASRLPARTADIPAPVPIVGFPDLGN
jgi:hypothetical protein